MRRVHLSKCRHKIGNFLSWGFIASRAFLLLCVQFLLFNTEFPGDDEKNVNFCDGSMEEDIQGVSGQVLPDVESSSTGKLQEDYQIFN